MGENNDLSSWVLLNEIPQTIGVVANVIIIKAGDWIVEDNYLLTTGL